MEGRKPRETTGLTGLVDCHAHIEMCGDPEEVVSHAAAAGVRRIVSVGTDLPSSEQAAGFAQRFESVYACVGVHPHDADMVDDTVIARLRELAGREKTVAIGETGLDFYRDRSPREAQKAAFIEHIRLARETGLPVMVHSRDAGMETLALLEEHAAGLTVILHCFSLYESVEECGSLGYYMSVAGNITFANARGLREAAARIPAGLLLTETDAPFLTPVPYRGMKPNMPGNIAHILRELAILRGETADDLAAQVRENFSSAFGAAV